MAESKAVSDRPVPARSFWASKLFLLAIVVGLAGAGLWIYASVTAPKAAADLGTDAASRSVSGLAEGLSPSSLVPHVGPPKPTDAGSTTAASASRLIDEASPAVTRLGFGFVAGFCMAFAFKKFLKIAAVVAGLVLLGIFGLQYLGVATIDWSGLEAHFERSLAWVKGEADSFKTFVTGYLPSTGAAAAGLITGFRRG